MIKNRCDNCKHLSVIVSQTSDYWCSIKNEYKNWSNFISNCDDFEADVLSLKEKENKVW